MIWGSKLVICHRPSSLSSPNRQNKATMMAVAGGTTPDGRRGSCLGLDPKGLRGVSCRRLTEQSVPMELPPPPIPLCPAPKTSTITMDLLACLPGRVETCLTGLQPESPYIFRWLQNGKFSARRSRKTTIHVHVNSPMNSYLN